MKSLPKIKGFTLLKWFVRLYFNPLHALNRVVKTVGKVVTFDGGKYQKLQLVSDPAFVKHILKTNKVNYKRSPVIKALKPLLGDGIFISEDSAWQSQRDQLKPSFHEDIIQQFETVILEECDAMCSTWHKAKGLVHVERELELLMLRILCKTQFCASVKVDYNEIHRAHAEVLKEASIRNQKLRFYTNRFRKTIGLPSVKQQQSAAITYLDTVADHIIAHGRNNHNDCSYWLKDMFVRNVGHKEIKDQILNFIFAGYDTTASALTWTLFNLTQNPNAQKECRKEAHQTDINFSNLARLQFTKRCIQESMRLYPPVWSIHRQSVEADEIEGYHFAPNTYFMICAYTMHRDPDFWDNPDAFIPNRFEGSKMRGKAFQYIPFGQGERICIGQSLAIMESQLIVSSIVKHFALKYPDKKPPKVTPGIIMKTEDGLFLDVSPAS